MERPKLGTVAVGDRVFVGRSGSYAPARITQAGPQVITVLPDSASKAIRFVRETQRQVGGGPNNALEMTTLEQRTYDERKRDAQRFLQVQGITPRFDTPWWGREVELADIIRAAMAQRDAS